ncbi:MAG: FGGY-family carbohydrate kinase [Pseudomonadales bacterium]
MAEPENRYVLAIDNGTQSVRALLFDQNGHLHAKSKVDIEPYVSREPGWAEQDPKYYWASLCEACEKLWPQLDVPRDSIAAVSVTTQRATLIALDEAGEPVYPAITWLDQRQVETPPALDVAESLLMRAVGAWGQIEHFHKQSEANWLAQYEPALWHRVHKFLLLSGYHVYRLTGHFHDAVASQVGYLPFDFKALKWADRKAWQWRAQAVTSNMLPKVYVAGETLGTISAAASEQTGIPEGLPLIASGSDKACEVLGSGCIDERTASMSYGTTATFNKVSNKYLEGIPFHPPYPGVVPGSYNVEMYVPRGYWMVSWFKNEFGFKEQQRAAEEGVAVETLFDDLLKAVPPGSMGLTLQPYWSSGAVDTGPEAKGAIIGFGDVHTRAHLYRALIEGLTYALREGKERVEKRSKQSINTLRVSGGGSQSDEVMQITADIFGMEVQRPHTFETSGLGAAMAAAVGAGIHPNFQSAVAAMTHIGDRFTPNAEHQATYEQLYSSVYLKMYKSLRPSYAAIRKITGYPR